jgi:hypothetical protein
MTSVRNLSLALAALLMLLLEGCAGTIGSGRRLTNADVTVVSYGSIQGELAPCG